MSAKIHVRNFQSIKDGKLEVKGLTALTGGNNAGKTALMRAVSGVFQNPPAAGYLRQGTDEFSVELEFSDGRKIAWKRGKRPCYVIDDGDPIYPGREIPEEVKAFGVLPITAGGQEVWPTLAPQVTGQVFLLDQPGSALAEAVSDVERVSKLNGALRNAESDRRSTQATLRVRRDDEAKFILQLEAFDGLDAVVAEVSAIEQALEKAQKVGRAVEGLQGLRDKLDAARNTVRRLSPVEEIAVPDTTKFAGLRKALDDVDDLRGLRKRMTAAWVVVGKLHGVENVSVPETADLSQMLTTTLEGYRALLKRLTASKATVTRYAGVETVEADFDTSKVEKIRNAMDVVAGFRDRLKTAKSEESRIEAELEAKEAEAHEAIHEVQDILGTFSECPTCGQGVHV